MPKLPLNLNDAWSLPVGGGAFEAGDAAWGITRGLPGLGRTPADDRLLALGFPHLVALADVDVDCAALADKDRLHKLYYPWQPGVWPRNLALRWLRGRAGLLDPEARTAALTGPCAPIDDHEVDDIARAALVEGSGRMTLLVLEAFVGTARVAEATVTAWETMSAEDWGRASTGAAAAIHFLLWRLPTEARDALHTRMVAVLAAVGEPTTWEQANTLRELDLAVHGSAALPRQKVGTSLFAALKLLGDDPGRVRDLALAELAKMKPAERHPFDVRPGVIGGEDVVRALTAARFQGMFHPAMVDQLGRVRADVARPALEALAAKGPAAKAAASWLAANPS